jgi:hypothetical protein
MANAGLMRGRWANAGTFTPLHLIPELSVTG